MEGNTSKAPKGECASCGKLVSKSNMAKHRKVCGKKKAPKTRKVINRESYKRHKDKILNKCFKQRVFNRFRRLEAACDFGSSTQEIYDFKLETVTGFNQLKVRLEADTDDLTEEVADGLSDAAYEREMNRIRRAKRDKAEGEATFSHLQDQLRMYRKRVEKHLASVSLHAANFQAKQEKAQALRDEELAKLKKVIEEFESKGPCATYDEFKESNVQPVQE
ncbi:hypothetical protein AM588_10003043 [Phytophthora nicotianae]|uniref:Uncharacterized protein n=1 Tax=Phytophthora nicotianae TaxID=4792 RepID=A0A0W8CYL2_PHYNI|nr:hypothetical protein AM588_10003043 [Phytophthora nicotianae]